MSGGHFDYKQYNINYIIDAIESELNKDIYSKVVQNKMKEAIKYLNIASTYSQRLDWFLSGDDSEETFLKRLEEELDTLSDNLTYLDKLKIYERAKRIVNSDLEWKDKYDMIFSDEISRKFDFYYIDYGSGYQDDVMFFMSSFDKYMEKQKIIYQQIDLE
jgi:hypothetical protein